jgi:uncharacterized delta-60 repeat protein
MKKVISLLFLLLIFNNSIWAQFGTLNPDSTFNYTSTVTRNNFVTNRILSASNNKVLCVGSLTHTDSVGTVVNSDFAISCFLSNGIIDSSFATNGYLVIDNGFNDEAFWHIENFDSGFLVLGYYNNANNNGWFYKAPGGDCFIIKINHSGSIDSTFGNNGVNFLSLTPKFNIADIKVTSNNDLFLLVNQQPYFGFTDKGKIIKLNQHGIIDTNFANQGIATLSLYLPQSMNILSDKSFVVLAVDTCRQLLYPYATIWQSACLSKLDSLGNIDLSFGLNGKKIISYGNIGFTVRTGISFGSGFYMYGEEGFFPNSHSIYKFDNLGILDNTFSGDGRLEIKVSNNSISNSWPLYSQVMKIFNNDLWLFGSTEINAMNCIRKSIIRISEDGVQDTTLGDYHFSPEPVFDQHLEDSTYASPFTCFEFSQWNDIDLQNDGKIIAAGNSSKNGDSTITTIPTGHIVSRLIPSNMIIGLNIVESQRNEKSNVTIKIYPNPFNWQTTIQVDHVLKNATLTLYNSYRQQVGQIKSISGQTVILHRDNLANGLYFIKLTQDNKIISANKIVITD